MDCQVKIYSFLSVYRVIYSKGSQLAFVLLALAFVRVQDVQGLVCFSKAQGSGFGYKGLECRKPGLWEVWGFEHLACRTILFLLGKHGYGLQAQDLDMFFCVVCCTVYLDKVKDWVQVLLQQ